MTIQGSCCCPSAGPPGSSQDRFAPKYLVGNGTTGDTAAAYNTAGFVYFADLLGDGSGIAAAIAAALIVPGDIHLRPGLFNLGLAGSPATPLTLPPGVVLRGAGKNLTTVRGRASGDQGVFVLGAGSGLHDISVVNTASAAGVGSTAMVRCAADGVSVERVAITFFTAIGQPLREGIRFEGVTSFPASEVLDLSVTASTTTSDTPTRCVVMGGQNLAIVSTRLVQCFGGNEAIYVENGSLIAKDTLCFNWTDYGLRASVLIQGSIRMDEGAFFSSGLTTAIGVSLFGQAHVLRSLVLQSNGAPGARGVEILQPGGSSLVQIDDCIIAGWDEGVVGGDLVGTTVSGLTIRDCAIFVGSTGVRIANPVGGGESTGCYINGNRIDVSPNGGLLAPVAGIDIINGNTHHVTDNEISVSVGQNDPLLTTLHGIFLHTSDPSLQCKLHTITANGVNVNRGGYGINVEGERNTVTGNIVQTNESEGCIRWADSDPVQAGVRNTITGNDSTFNGSTPTSAVTGLPSAMVGESRACAVTGNTVFKGNGGDPSGITLTATSGSTPVTGNLVDAGGGSPIFDLGALNSSMNNIGA